MTNQLLELLPNHERANGNKAFYEKHLKEEDNTKPDKKLKGDDGSDELDEDIVVRQVARKTKNYLLILQKFSSKHQNHMQIHKFTQHQNVDYMKCCAVMIYA